MLYKLKKFSKTNDASSGDNNMAYNVFGLGEGGDFHHKC
jgi:hypothetical protein